MADGKFFKEEDVKAAQDALQGWVVAHPDAAKALKELWSKHYMTAGHKTMARELVNKK